MLKGFDHKSPAPRRIALFKNGRSQAVRIPREFELPGGEALLYREGERLILEPVPEATSLIALLESLPPLEASLPDGDETLPPLDSVDL